MALADFESISLAEMNRVRLLNRTDVKFVLPEAQLLMALAGLSAEYRVLSIDNNQLNHYRTLYFDTPDFALYFRHHAGGRNRYKVRSREYVDTQLNFLEVKQKVNRYRTVKSRLQTPELVTSFTPDTAEFMQSHFPYRATKLEPKLWNAYTRITLVNRYQQERVTLDLDLRFSHLGRGVALPGMAIAEVKQDGVNRHSPFMKAMRQQHVHAMGLSKYCLGVALLYNGIKANNFKPKLRHVYKVAGDIRYEH